MSVVHTSNPPVAAQPAGGNALAARAAVQRRRFGRYAIRERVVLPTALPQRPPDALGALAATQDRTLAGEEPFTTLVEEALVKMRRRLLRQVEFRLLRQLPGVPLPQLRALLRAPLDQSPRAAPGLLARLHPRSWRGERMQSLARQAAALSLRAQAPLLYKLGDVPAPPGVRRGQDGERKRLLWLEAALRLGREPLGNPRAAQMAAASIQLLLKTQGPRWAGMRGGAGTLPGTPAKDANAWGRGWGAGNGVLQRLVSPAPLRPGALLTTPTELVMFVPPVQLGQYGASAPRVGNLHWEAHGGTASEQAMQLARSSQSAWGGAFRPAQTALPERTDSAPAREARPSAPRSLNQPVVHLNKQTQTLDVDHLKERELNHLVERVYGKLEARIQLERRRRGR